MQSIQYVGVKLQKWQEKAKSRSKMIQKLKRANHLLRESRDNWKAKYQAEKARHKKTQKELSARAPATATGPNSIRPRGHRYNLWQILFSLKLRQSGNCSLRGCSAIFSTLSEEIGLSGPIPSHTNIRNWEMKLGYSRIEHQSYGSDPWVLIPDESMCLGQECILLLLGVRLSQYQLGKALSFEDVRVLSISIAKSWKSEQIDQVIEDLKAKGLKIAYAVSDGGLNLVKSLKTKQIPRVADCTHAFSNWVENRYKKQELFEQYSKQCARFKQKIAMSKYAQYMPPMQRSKARFLNLGTLAKWGTQMLKLLDQEQIAPQNELAQKLKWIIPYKDLIEELSQVTRTIDEVCCILKNQGLSLKTKIKCNQVLEKLNPPEGLKQAISNYLTENLNKFTHRKKLICSSDIIESFFGKFKNKFNSSPACGLTPSVLTLALYPQKFSQKEILTAFESTKIKDIEKWREDNLKINLAKKRKIAFKNVT